MMKPLTAAEIRELLAKQIPAELRWLVTEMCWSSHDLGVSSGLAKQSRLSNPFESLLTSATPSEPKRKR